jgi:hypothetical protein
MHPPVPVAEPLPDNVDDLYTSRTPVDINMEDSIEDSQGESLSSRATLDILLYGDTDAYMQEPPLLREPSPVSEQLPIFIDGQEPAPMSPGEVKLWVQDNPCALPAVGSNSTSVEYTRPSSPSLPNTLISLIHRRIISGGRYKVSLSLLPPTDNTPI